MSNKNIEFTRRNFTIADNDFYTFDHIGNLLCKFNNTGKVVYSYPLIGGLESEVLCAVYDGFNFWTLENVGEDDFEGVVIKKWEITKNFYCKLIKTMPFNSKVYSTFGNVIYDPFNVPSDYWATISDNFEINNGTLEALEGADGGIYSKEFNSLSNFLLEVKVAVVATSSTYIRVYFYIRLYKDGVVAIEFQIFIHSGYIYYYVHLNSVNVFNRFVYCSYVDETKIITIKQEVDGLSFLVNNEVLFESSSTFKVNEMSVSFAYATAYEYIRINEVIMEGVFGNHIFKSETFALEHYSTTFKNSIEIDTTAIPLSDPYIDIIAPGDVLKLGPNKDGYYENVTISGYIGNGYYGLSFFTSYEYDIGDPITIDKHVWLFNDYTATEDVGALYKFKASDGEFISYYSGNNFKEISACTISEIDDIEQIGIKNCLMYVSAATIKFLDVYDPTKVHCTMLIDNYDGAEIFKIYGIIVNNSTIYRLQLKTNYFDTVYVESSYNYQCSPIRNFVETVLLSVTPIILPNTGVNTSEVRCSSNDQYGYPSVRATALFTENSDTGYIGAPITPIGVLGNAETFYMSGTEIDTITIGVEVIQQK